MITGNERAFPESAKEEGHYYDHTAQGMSYRMWLAGKSLQGYTANPEAWKEWDSDAIAAISVSIADKLIEALNKPTGNP